MSDAHPRPQPPYALEEGLPCVIKSAGEPGAERAIAAGAAAGRGAFIVRAAAE